MHPLNCSPERPSGACNLKIDKSSTWGVDFFQTCFPTIDRMLEALQPASSSFLSSVTAAVAGEPSNSNGNKNNVDCVTMVTQALQGNGPRVQSNHLYFNYFYNYNRTILNHPQRDVWVVRQESLWPDLKQIETMLGGDGRRKFEHEGPIITHASEKFPYKIQTANLNPVHLPVLCCILRDEILVYAYLLHNAVNLEAVQKTTSMSNLLSKCRADSLRSLSNSCGWKMTTTEEAGIDGNPTRRLGGLWPMLDVTF